VQLDFAFNLLEQYDIQSIKQFIHRL